MHKRLDVVYENGVFRTAEPVDFPEGIQAAPESRASKPFDQPSSHRRLIYELLSRSEDTGDRRFLERHNENQP